MDRSAWDQLDLHLQSSARSPHALFEPTQPKYQITRSLQSPQKAVPSTYWRLQCLIIAREGRGENLIFFYCPLERTFPIKPWPSNVQILNFPTNSAILFPWLFSLMDFRMHCCLPFRVCNDSPGLLPPPSLPAKAPWALQVRCWLAGETFKRDGKQLRVRNAFRKLFSRQMKSQILQFCLFSFFSAVSLWSQRLPSLCAERSCG